MDIQTGKRLYSLKEIARSWGICVQTVRNYIKAGILNSIRIDDMPYISEDESIRYQKSKSVIKLLKKPVFKLLKPKYQRALSSFFFPSALTSI